MCPAHPDLQSPDSAVRSALPSLSAAAHSALGLSFDWPSRLPSRLPVMSWSLVGREPVRTCAKFRAPRLLASDCICLQAPALSRFLDSRKTGLPPLAPAPPGPALRARSG